MMETMSSNTRRVLPTTRRSVTHKFCVAGHEGYLTLGLFGGFSLPLYSITVAHANDYLNPDQRIGGASSLYVFLGMAATLGR